MTPDPATTTTSPSADPAHEQHPVLANMVRWCEDNHKMMEGSQPSSKEGVETRLLAMGYFKGVQVGWGHCWDVAYEHGLREGRKRAAEAAYLVSKARFKEAWAEGGRVVLIVGVGIFTAGMVVARALLP